MKKLVLIALISTISNNIIMGATTVLADQNVNSNTIQQTKEIEKDVEEDIEKDVEEDIEGNTINKLEDENIKNKEKDTNENSIDELKEEDVEIEKKSKLEEIKILIRQFYKGLQNREADNEGLNYWAMEIYNNKRTVAEVIESFINSEEFKNYNYTPEEFIKRSYTALLGRTPDSDGFNSWLNVYNEGYSKKYILYSHFNSVEFQNKLKQIGITNIGNITLTLNDKIPAIRNIIKQFYKGFHGREADLSGLSFWSDEIINEKRNISDIIEGFINSDEFKNNNLSEEEFIKRTYIAFFGRNPDKEGFDLWLSKYRDGYTKKFIVYNHFYSEEFRKSLSELGIKKVGELNITIYDLYPEVKALVNSFYNGFLGREGDLDGLTYWTNKVVNSEIYISELIESFINSEEFKNKKYSSEEIVRRNYIALLNREPDLDGINYKLNLIMNGASNKYILHSIFYSDEFKSRIRDAKIEKIGDIMLSDNDRPRAGFAKGIIKNFEMNLRSSPNSDATTNIDLPIGTEVIILGRSKGDIDCYEVKVAINGKILTGYIRRIVSYKETIEIYSDDVNNSNLGILSEKYESNGDPGLISTGVGDYGGKSYGAWQFSSTMGSLDEFINGLKQTKIEFYNRFQNAILLDNGKKYGENFDNEWRKIARENYTEFYNLQHDHIENKYYNALVKRLLKVDDISHLLNSFSVRNVLWSTAVQHGVTGSYSIIKQFTNKTDIIEFIQQIYGERGRKDENGILVHFSRNSLEVQAGVARRFVNEEKDAIRMFGYENKTGQPMYKIDIKENLYTIDKEIKISKEEAFKIVKEKYSNDKDIDFVIDEKATLNDDDKGYRVHLISKDLRKNGGNGYLFSVFVNENGSIIE